MTARRVLFLDHTAQLGGGEVALLNLLKNLDRRRYQPVVLLFENGPLRSALDKAGVSTDILPLSAGIGGRRKDALAKAGPISNLIAAARAAGFIRKLAKRIRASGADVVHCNSLKSDILGGLAARYARVPCVWHVRDRIADDYLPARTARLFRRMCRVLPERVICVSDAVRETIVPSRAKPPTGRRGRFAGRVSVVHDGTPLGPPPPDDPPGEAGRPVHIGLVGRISPWKGQHVFLQAARQVAKHHPEARFVLIGSALFGEQTYEHKLHDLVESLGLKSVVEFVGFVSDVPRRLRQLDLLVHASTSGEPFGQVIVEAMAAGRAVVATDGGGVPEIVRHGRTGLLVPMNNPRLMAKAIGSLLRDPARRAAYGRAGRRRVEERFDIRRTAAGVAGEFDKLLRRPPAATAAVTEPPPRPDLSSQPQ